MTRGTGLALATAAGMYVALGLAVAPASSGVPAEEETRPTPTPTPTPTPGPGHSFTNDDLEKYSGHRPAEPAAKPSATASEAPSSSKRNRDEEVWRKRAASGREEIAKAEAKVAELEDRLRALTLDVAPNSGDLLAPDRLGQREREKAEVAEELEAARKQVEEARQRLSDLEEEARRKSVPPGWLREP